MEISVRTREKIPLWRDERFLRWTSQVISAILVLGILAWVVLNFLSLTRQRGISLSFAFLKEPAGFPIAESFIPYKPTMSFGRAFTVGLVNTMVVSVLGIVLATILGFFIGVARLSSNWLVSRIALAYIEFHRNIPLLVLLFLWYFGVFSRLPPPKESFILPGLIYVNQRGLYLPWPRLTETGQVFLVGVLISGVLAVITRSILRRVQEQSGRETHFTFAGGVVLLLGVGLSGLAARWHPFYWDRPALQGFNFKGGQHLSPEFFSLLIGLTMYTAAFIAEVFRAGILAVPRGQIEAARSLGLKYRQILSMIVIPQALRVVIPPLISQYLNLTKNSSLALAIGYQELFAVGKITINQAGQAVMVFLMVMATYLIISLLTSLVLNIYNRRVQFLEK